MNSMISLSSFPKLAGVAAVLVTTFAVVPKSQAAALTFFDSVPAGATQFDNIVTRSGNTVVTDRWTSLAGGSSIDRGAYSFSRINGNSLVPTTYNTLTGQVISIAPSSRDVLLSRSSGIEFNFDNPVNALGFEVGDWGTCCQPSALYISFDNGAPIQVGISLTTSDAFIDGKYEIFVGAIDDTAKFSKVQFWGDGAGEALFAGGTIRYADVAIGSVSPTAVPEPFTIVGTLIGAGAAFRMRKRLKVTNKL